MSERSSVSNHQSLKNIVQGEINHLSDETVKEMLQQ